MIQHTGKISCNTICINQIIDGGTNPNKFIDLTDILCSNKSLEVVNKITPEWRQTIRHVCISYEWCTHRFGQQYLIELQSEPNILSQFSRYIEDL